LTWTSEYCISAHEYAKRVVAGDVLACKHVIAACQRQLDDLARQHTDKSFEFTFDEHAAHRVCAFIEGLPHVKGKWKTGNITLEPWQCFLLTTIFGWKRPDGTRRFRQVYIEIPRKNAKSTLSAGVALYMLALDGEPGAEVYSAAVNRDQAKIVFEEQAKRMVEREKALQSQFGLKAWAHSIVQASSGSKFQALAAQTNSLDGLNVHCGIIDELHAHTTREVFDVIETATGSRSQPLLWSITTAGSNRSGVCYEQRGYILKILNGSVTDETVFGVVYTIDDEDDWTDEIIWAKANPNFGVSVDPDDLKRKASKALQSPASQSGFLTKHLNVWVNADQAWMDMRSWDRCSEEPVDIKGFEGDRCWIFADLATKRDVASVALLFKKNGKTYGFTRHYVNEEAVESQRNAMYPGWDRSGHLIVTSGNITDFGRIEEDIREDAKRFKVQAIGFDPWQAAKISSEMATDGLPAVEVQMGPKNFSAPMKELEARVVGGKFKSDGNPVTTWMISNVVCHVDRNDNIYPLKERAENKIDGAVALIGAMGLMIREDESSVYENRGIRVV
jgi:phage terminase large subunit-like protein